MHVFYFRFPAICALTTVILAIGEVNGELRSAELEYTYEHINVALATCMHNFGRPQDLDHCKIEWIPFFLLVAHVSFCRQFDGFTVRPRRPLFHFSSGVHRSALSLYVVARKRALLVGGAAGCKQSRSQIAR